MKKVFTLFLLLLCVATGWATNYKVAATYTPLSELTSGYYVIRVFSDKANADNGSYLYANESGNEIYNEAKNSTSNYEGGSTLTNAYYVWKVFVDKTNGVKTFQIQNVGKDRFIAKATQGGNDMFNGENIAIFYAEENENTTKGFRLKTNGIYLICDGNRDVPTQVGKLGNWATTSENCAQFRMFKVGFDVTYNFKLDGQTYTKKITALGGETPQAAYNTFYTTPGYVQVPFPTEALTEDGTTTFNLSCTKNNDYPVTPNKWYFVKIGLQGGSSTRDGYLFDNNGAQIPTNNKTKKLSDATYVWKFVGNPFDGYQLINGSGKSLIATAYNNSRDVYPYAAAPSKITTACCDRWDVQGTSVVAGGSQPTYWSNNAFVLSAHNHGNYQMHAYSNNQIGYWKSTGVDLSSAITLDAALPEITLNALNNKNYATYYLPFAAKAPEGVTAYAGTINNGNVQLTEYANGVIPANKGVVLVSDTKTTATFTLADASDVVTELANDLTGVLTETELNSVKNSDQVRIFSKKDNVAGFYKPNSGITSLAANKAYIMAPTNEGALVLNFAGGEVTGINQATINATESNAPIYDLTGRRVAKAVKGIYVKNGKKFIVK